MAEPTYGIGARPPPVAGAASPWRPVRRRAPRAVCARARRGSAVGRGGAPGLALCLVYRSSAGALWEVRPLRRSLSLAAAVGLRGCRGVWLRVLPVARGRLAGGHRL